MAYTTNNTTLENRRMTITADKAAAKPTITLVLVKDEDGTTLAYMTIKGAKEIPVTLNIYAVSEGVYGDLEAESVDTEPWADMPRKVKAAYKELN